jgi:hypothetical protein
MKREYEYENFEDWFNEMEGFSFRSERLLSFFPDDRRTRQILEDWMRAAFDSARLENGNETKTEEDGSQKPL